MVTSRQGREKGRKTGESLDSDEISLGNDGDILEVVKMATLLCDFANSHWVIL